MDYFFVLSDFEAVVWLMGDNVPYDFLLTIKFYLILQNKIFNLISNK
jgi:hypothetical protein